MRAAVRIVEIEQKNTLTLNKTVERVLWILKFSCNEQQRTAPVAATASLLWQLFNHRPRASELGKKE